MLDHWGEGESIDLFAPSIAGDEGRRRGFGLYERASASPAMLSSLLDAVNGVDVTSVLPVIDVPTLVLHRAEDPVMMVGGARFMAERIPAASCVELTGVDHMPWLGDADALLDEVEQFLTGARQSRVLNRVLATVLSPTSSTRRGGHRSWETVAGASC